jgi:hypothetical protein
MPVSNHSQPVTLSESLASRYEALAHIAELIRSHPEEKVLFQTCASELHQVVAFDGLSWFDPAVHWVQWHFLEPYELPDINSKLKAKHLPPIYELSEQDWQKASAETGSANAVAAMRSRHLDK